MSGAPSSTKYVSPLQPVSVSAVSPAAPNAPATKRWPTPRRLRAFMVLAWIGCALLFAVGETTLSNARRAVHTIKVESAPSIIAALEMRALMADLDANAANVLLDSAQHSASAMQVFEDERVLATTRMIEAAQNITYGDAEKLPLVRIAQGMGRYLQFFGEAKYRYNTGDAAGALVAYRAATELMHKTILPATDALDDANKSAMRTVYDDERRSNDGAEAVATLVGVMLVVVLLWTQLFLLRRTRRLLNVPLVVASIAAIAFTSFLVARFNAARTDLKIAKEDAFESIHTMSKLRAYAFDANGDESRGLLDRDNEKQFELAFDNNIRVISSAPDYPASMQRELAALRTPSGMGLVFDELNNITFQGERDAAIAVAQELARYYRLDGKIRGLAHQRTEPARKQAIQLCLGESNQAFERLDDAAKKVIAINRTVFDDVLDQADRGLKLAEILDPIFAIVIAALTLIGIRMRLREYA